MRDVLSRFAMMISLQLTSDSLPICHSLIIRLHLCPLVAMLIQGRLERAVEVILTHYLVF